MPTLRSAAELFSHADTIEGLARIASFAGFDGKPAPLDREAKRALGIDDLITDAHVCRGDGALRGLLVSVREDLALRDLLPRLAALISSRAPHVLWMVIARQQPSAVAIAAWTDDRRPPRISALVADSSRVMDSDADTLRALAAAATDRDLLTHARWVEVLGREALSLRFYRALERAVAGIAQSSSAASHAVRSELALLNTSRLLFLSFLEAKGWLNGDRAFLAGQFDRCATRVASFHDRALRPLFFGTLNTPYHKRAAAARAMGRVPFLNGGLFSRTPLERRHANVTFSNDAYGVLLYDVFGQFRFTAREETADCSEAAIDPEMLGHAFESLMVQGERRRTGAFFTPFALVERVTNAGIEAALEHQTLRQITVLDPACGSGAFLVHALERLSVMRHEEGDARDRSSVRRDVLTHSIFGVDVNPTAVWLCALRLWLSVIIDSAEEDPSKIAPLPNLDRNIRVGDSLAGQAFGKDPMPLRGGGALRVLRERYTVASGSRKDALARQLDRSERVLAVQALDAQLAAVGARRRDLLVAWRGSDLFGGRYRPSRDERATSLELRQRAGALRRLRQRIHDGGALPFSFPAHFADVAALGGFSLLVGNPPWVRLHHVAADQRGNHRRDYDVARHAAWEPGASPAGAATGFAGQVDMAALFVERSVRLLAPGGALALLLPVKLWRSLAGGGVRRLLERETTVSLLEDHSEGPAAFDAAVYPSVIVATRSQTSSDARPNVRAAVHHRGNAPFTWSSSPSSISFDESPGAPWLLLPPDARQAFDRIRKAGIPLAASAIGRPHLGVKCGCNDAFIVRLMGYNAGVAEVVTANGKCVAIEASMLKPLVRGEHLRRWQVPDSDERIVWTHDNAGAILAELPPCAARWLARWRRELTARSDAHHRSRWWGLFRTEAARSYAPRVVWADLGREPRASVLLPGSDHVPLNSCYVAPCRHVTDAFALSALLNAPIARAWLNALAEPARGGYRRYLGWTLSLLPVPTDWHRARDILAPIGEAAHRGSAPTEADLVDASLDAYGVPLQDVAPLVAWCAE